MKKSEKILIGAILGGVGALTGWKIFSNLKTTSTNSTINPLAKYIGSTYSGMKINSITQNSDGSYLLNKTLSVSPSLFAKYDSYGGL